MKNVSIAIDGPSGAGKSTLARALAKEKGYFYVDTGAIYRTLGYYVRRRGADPKDEVEVLELLRSAEVELRYGEDGLQHMFLNGEDVSREIRLPEVSKYASIVSAHAGVRAFLLEMQRELAWKHSVVMDGRDIGTVVLPDADVKIRQRCGRSGGAWSFSSGERRSRWIRCSVRSFSGTGTTHTALPRRFGRRRTPSWWTPRR